MVISINVRGEFKKIIKNIINPVLLENDEC